MDDLGGHDKPQFDGGLWELATQGAAPKVHAGVGGKSKLGMTLVMTGAKELDRVIEQIAAEEGPRSINATLRTFLRETVKEIVLPQVMEMVPYDDGRGAYKDEGQHLEDMITIRALPRSRKRAAGYYVGFRSAHFKDGQGPAHYAKYIEFGWDHVGGFHVEADSFLRRALYPNANRIVNTLRVKVWNFIGELNRAA